MGSAAKTNKKEKDRSPYVSSNKKHLAAYNESDSGSKQSAEKTKVKKT